MSKKENIASVLAFEKKLVPSDGRMSGCNWENKNLAIPLKLIEKSVRGTISNRLNAVIQKDPMALNNKIKNANPQKVDACALNATQDTLKLHFTLKVLGGLQHPSACNNPLFKQSYQEAVNHYIQQEGMKTLARRYALNIANARFLWRNRLGAEHIQVEVKQLNTDKHQSWVFNALDFNLRDMDTISDEVDSLAAQIAEALSSEENFLILDIVCYAKVGIAQDIYPSEELVMDKGKGEKSKILYAVDDTAAMHSQKIGNALRTIDTWYPEYQEVTVSAGAIAIEPYGAVTNRGKAFRTPVDKQDFYTFFDIWARGGKLQRLEDAHYVMAVLVRGGVFGESDK